MIGAGISGTSGGMTLRYGKPLIPGGFGQNLRTSNGARITSTIVTGGNNFHNNIQKESGEQFAYIAKMIRTRRSTG